MKVLLRICFPILCFLLFFSVFRSINGQEPLTINGLLQAAKGLDINFDTTVDALNVYRYFTVEVFQNAGVVDIFTFFIWIGKFFTWIMAPWILLVSVVIDVLGLLRTLFGFVFTLLGIKSGII